MTSKSYYNFFVNFANKTKFDIIMSLKEKSMNVSQIVEKIGAEQSAVSHNLKDLAECNIVEVKQKGKQRIYSLNKKTIIPLLKNVENHVCKCCKLNCAKSCRN